jgi:hypothetical protein
MNNTGISSENQQDREEETDYFEKSSCLMKDCCGCCSLRSGATILIVVLILSVALEIPLAITSNEKYQWLVVIPCSFLLIIYFGGLYGVWKKHAILIRNVAWCNLLMSLISLIANIVSNCLKLLPEGIDGCARKEAEANNKTFEDGQKTCKTIFLLLTVITIFSILFFSVIQFFFTFVLWSYYKHLQRQQGGNYARIPNTAEAVA